MDILSQADQVTCSIISPQVIPGLHGFFVVITQLGNVYLWIMASAVYLLVGKHKLIAAAFLIALLFGGVATEDLKDIFHRSRPIGADYNTYLADMSYSFPSQHSQTAFFLATLLAGYFGFRRYGVIAYSLAGIVGISRIYLGVHYLTDVVAGAVLGIVMGEMVLLGWYIYGLIGRRWLLVQTAELAGIRLPSLQVSDRLQFIAVVVSMAGISISATALILGGYFISLITVIFAYLAIIMLPVVIRWIDVLDMIL